MPRFALLQLLLAASPALASSPLFSAVEANDPTAVRAAVADGADLNEIGDGGEAPVVLAARSDKLRAPAALMKLGADASARGSDGLTALQIAALRGNGKIVRMLLRYKVDTDERAADGLTAFHRACTGSEAGQTDAVFAFLDAGVAPDQRTADGRTCIDMAGSENTRKLLLEALQEKRRRGPR